MTTGARLRIAFVTDTYDIGHSGGVLTAQRFVGALRRRHDVTLVTTGEPGKGRVALPSFYPPPFGRIMRKMGFVFAVPRRGLLEETFRRADVIHVQFPFWLGIRSATIARRLGKPVVAVFHVQPQNLLYNLNLRSETLSEWMYRFFIRTLYARADAVVCPSPFALEELRRHGLTVAVEVISNGIAPEFQPQPFPRHERHQGRVVVVAVGRLAREKRLDVVIEGLRRSRHAGHIQLVIMGKGPEEGRVRRLARSLPVPAEVGFVSTEDLRRLLNTADLMVHASEVELEGMAVLEALGCGTPALISNASHSASRQFAISPDFLFEAGDPEDLARRLDLLLDDPRRLRAARARCLALAADYSFEESLLRLEALYRRVATPPAEATRPAASLDTPGGRSAVPGKLPSIIERRTVL